ncbi:MAG: PfaD family polyunsaturated fatty acid/polyketide biosynthesis protein [Desulfuromonadales bacterium]|nr:PfaD family polyunsaturated fatty acid/polyketide biosynthesis protein [Desulfuromonadales bacterium]
MHQIDLDDQLAALRRIDRPVALRNTADGLWLDLAAEPQPTDGLILPCPLENLGEPEFCRAHSLRYPYVGGSMAKGISSVAMVEAFGEAGMLGFFGAAGLLPDQVEAAIDQLQRHLAERPFGCNLIHSPHEPELEEALVDLYLRRGIGLIEASAFLDLTPALVRYRTHGIGRDSQGRVTTPNRVLGKVSREEVAAKFFAPPPEKLLRALVASGALSAEQAELAATIPMAEDVTAEADSGGHTDNRPALALLPTIQAQRDSLQRQHRYPTRPRVGLGGGIGTPAAAAAAFALGADYLVTGTVNQACVEAGTCAEVRQMLAATRQADVTMAPSGDMFEMGVTVQVIKRGSMFPMRAARLYELYRSHASLDDIPAGERQKLEKTVFQKSFAEVWEETRHYFLARNPKQVDKAEQDPKHKMALVFRWYLGLSPVWANQGIAERRLDYQVWCGPAMGSFNEWCQGSFLADIAQRRVATVALNLLFGAAVLTRYRQFRLQGGWLPDVSALTPPLPLDQIKEYLR